MTKRILTHNEHTTKETLKGIQKRKILISVQHTTVTKFFLFRGTK